VPKLFLFPGLASHLFLGIWEWKIPEKWAPENGFPTLTQPMVLNTKKTPSTEPNKRRRPTLPDPASNC